MINPFLRSSSYSAKIDTIHSFFPLVLTLDQFRLLDHEKTWLYIGKTRVIIPVIKSYKHRAILGTVAGMEADYYHTPSEQAAEDIRLPINFDANLHVKSLRLHDVIDNQIITVENPKAIFQYASHDDTFQTTIDSSFNKAQLKLQLAGKFNNFILSAQLSGDEFDLWGYPTKNVQGTIHLNNVPSQANGTAVFTVFYDENPLNLEMQLQDSKTELKLDDIRLSTKNSSVTANLKYIYGQENLAMEFDGNIEDDWLVSILTHSNAQGKIKAQGTWQQTPATKHLKANATLRDLDIYRFKIKDIEVEVDTQFSNGTPSGHVNITGQKVVSPQVTFDTTILKANFKDKGAQLSLSAKGKDSNIETQIDVKQDNETYIFNIQNLEALYNETSIKTISPTKVVWQDNTITLSKMQIQVLEFVSTIHGTYDNGNLDFKLNGETDLQALAPLLPPDQFMSGHSKFNLQLNGSIDEPRLSGNLSLTDGTYENLTSGTYFNDIRLDAIAHQGLININEATARGSDKGSLNLGGEINITTSHVDLKASANELPIATFESDVFILKSGNITLKGPFDALKLAGDVIVQQAPINIATAAFEQIPIIPVDVPLPIEAECVKILDAPTSLSTMNITTDLQIHFPNSLRIYGKGLNSIWKGDLHVTGQIFDPRILGMLTIDSGTLDFLSAQFKLTKGSIQFLGGGGLIPYLNLTAETQANGLDITVETVGNINALKFNLQSTPSVPQDQILSRLFFGKNPSELSVFEAIQLARAIAMFNNVGPSTDFTSLIRSNLGLDQLSFGALDGGNSAFVKVGKRLSDKVTVNLNQSANVEDSKVEINVDITSDLRVFVEQGLTGAEEAAGISYKHDYN